MPGCIRCVALRIRPDDALRGGERIDAGRNGTDEGGWAIPGQGVLNYQADVCRRETRAETKQQHTQNKEESKAQQLAQDREHIRVVLLRRPRF